MSVELVSMQFTGVAVIFILVSLLTNWKNLPSSCFLYNYSRSDIFDFQSMIVDKSS